MVDVATAGSLRERISFQANTAVDDGAGGCTDSWANITSDPTVWAKVMPVKGRETLAGGKMTATQTYLVTVRNRSDITTAWRIVWGSLNLNIRSVENRDMRDRFITMECEEGVPD